MLCALSAAMVERLAMWNRGAGFTAIREEWLTYAAGVGGDIVVRLPNRQLCPVRPFYQAVGPGKPVAVPGSSGFLEIALNGGHAAHALRLRRGSVVTLQRISTRSPGTRAPCSIPRVEP